MFLVDMKDSMWFALDGEKAEYKYSYNYQSWYPSKNTKHITPRKMLACLI